MLCVICLRNTACNKPVCSNCQELNLPNCNKNVEDSIAKKLLEIPSERQIKIIKLTHKRFQSLVKISLSKEFNLTLVLKDYLDMNSRDDDLEMAVSKNHEHKDGREYYRQTYDQYRSPAKE